MEGLAAAGGALRLGISNCYDEDTFRRLYEASALRRECEGLLRGCHVLGLRFRGTHMAGTGELPYCNVQCRSREWRRNTVDCMHDVPCS